MAIITAIDERGITFSDGSTISCCHSPDCCEYNYADFEQLDDIARNTEFDTDNMVFKDECTTDYGFLFGNEPTKMFFIPCYSEQSGYYSSDVNICYNDVQVLNTECEIHTTY